MDWIAASKPWLSVEPEIEAAHRPALDLLMAHADLMPGQQVLDIGCGMGMSLLAAAEAVGLDGHVSGVDIAPPMVDRANARAPRNARVMLGDAGTHAFEPATFDAAISLFGTMFFDDTAQAFANIRKALRPEARFVFCAWGPPPQNPWFGIGRAAVEARLGAQPRPEPAASGPFRFADPGPVVAMLEDAGFTAGVDTVAVDLSPRGSAADVAALQMTLGSAAMLLREIDPAPGDLAAVEATMTEAFGRLENGAGVRVPAVIHVFAARAA